MNWLRMSKVAAWPLLAALVLCASGCAWMGKAAGKAQAKVENKIEAMDRNYNESYDKERARGSSEERNTGTETEE
ncbi:MAG: hypothetical protein LBJ82_03655 [Deltaproteobacteria bacterium]|nr:hypothetical protein [Deltaproteobacteria bacterium]